MKRKLLCIVLMAVMLFCVTGCGDEKEKLIGEWEYSSGYENILNEYTNEESKNEMKKELGFILYDDGSASLAGRSGEWSVADNTLQITVYSNSMLRDDKVMVCHYKVSGKKLTLTDFDPSDFFDGSEKMVYKKD